MIVVKSFDGTSLDTSTYRAGIPGDEDGFRREVDPIVLDVVGGFPRYEGGNQQAVTFALEVECLAPTKANIDALMTLFRAGHSGELRVEWDAEARIRDCAVLSVHPLAGSANIFVVSLLAADARWRSAALLTETVSMSSSPGGVTVNNPGTAIEDRAVFTLTPTTNKAAADAQRFRQYAIIANRSERALLDHPIDLTNYLSSGPSGGLGHAALVTATKSQADADDLRALLNGREIPRYLGEHTNTDANSTRTTIWVAPVWSAAQRAHLRAAITSGAPADGGELEVLSDEVRTWPRKGYLVNTTSGEVIAYSGWTRRNASGYSAFTGIRRAQWGTAAASGATTDTLYRAENKLEIVYGHTSRSAPESRPDAKPLLDLASNTLSNQRHEWINFYSDLYPARPGQWARAYEPRDTQAGYLWLPTGSPAADIHWTSEWRSEPVGKDNFNVMRRAFPTGTAGAAAQLAFTRTVDATLALAILATLDNGQELNVGTLRGPLTSSSYSSTWTNKAYELRLYARSQVMISTPEVDDATLMDNALGSILSGQINATNTIGALIDQIVKNDTDDDMVIRALQLLVWQPDANRDTIFVRVFPDDGSGGIGSASFVSQVIAPAAAPTWITVTPSTPFPLIAGGQVHVQPNNVSHATISQTRWEYSPVFMNGAFPFYAVRFLGDGVPAEYARPEGGTVSGVAPDDIVVDGLAVNLDTAAIPYFAISAELDCYELNGTLANETTEQSIRFSIYCTTGDEIEIDVGARTVRNLTTGEDGLLFGIDPDDEEAWLSLVPGDNAVTWTETGCAGMDLDVAYYGRWE